MVSCFRSYSWFGAGGSGLRGHSRTVPQQSALGRHSQVSGTSPHRQNSAGRDRFTSQLSFCYSSWHGVLLAPQPPRLTGFGSPSLWVITLFCSNALVFGLGGGGISVVDCLPRSAARTTAGNQLRERFSDLQLRQINDQMILVERSFVDPNGLLVDDQNR